MSKIEFGIGKHLKKDLGKKGVVVGLGGLAVLAVLVPACSSSNENATAPTTNPENVGKVTVNSDQVELGPLSQQALDATVNKIVDEKLAKNKAAQEEEARIKAAREEGREEGYKKFMEIYNAANQKKLDEKGFSSAQPETALSIKNARVNGVDVDSSLFNEKDNPHELYRNATGINAGKNYKLDLPEGWSAITASLSAEIQREGGEPVANTNSPVIIIIGPFVGGAGLWEGAIYIVPTEWLKAVSERVLATQRKQTGKPELPITTFDK